MKWDLVESRHYAYGVICVFCICSAVREKKTRMDDLSLFLTNDEFLIRVRVKFEFFPNASSSSLVCEFQLS